MKLDFSFKRRRAGSVLIVTLFIACMFGIFLGSYLYLVRQQRQMVARSQAWNFAFAIAEAGVEEALAQLNPGAPAASIDRTANGWGSPVAGRYGPKTRNLSAGSYSVWYTTNTFPIIYATGYVTVPTLSSTIKRTICVNTTNVSLANVVLGARNGINLSGNNITTDSFNSALTNLSTNQRYDSTKTSTNGDIATLTGTVALGSANINGSVLLGPTANYTIKNNGFFSGGVENDFNFDFPTVQLPQTTWMLAAPAPQTIDGVLYSYVFNSTFTNDYYIPNLSANIYVNTNAHVRLKLTGTSATTGTIRVAGPGVNAGSLTVYVDCPSFDLTGNSVIDGGRAANFTMLGTTNCTSFKMSGNASYTGTLYAPQASFTLGGGGSSNYDFVGSIIVNNMNLNGNYNFHFDEDLLATGPSKGYAANGWREL